MREEKTTLIPCIVCGRELDAYDVQINQPSGGTAFRSPGHYGSTVFDPMGDGSYIEINICDGCLGDAADSGKVLHGRNTKPVVVEGVMVGRTEARRELVVWDRSVRDREVLELSLEDLEYDRALFEVKIEWQRGFDTIDDVIEFARAYRKDRKKMREEKE